ncbi:MAG TPA: DUF6772 family protein [Pyrinomonadaceae bacterium]|jgi:hypothetical protein
MSKQFIAYDYGLSKYNPLETILCYDDFDRGACGWTDLTPNFTLENFDARPSIIDKAKWGPPMLSTATYSYVGTHGSMDGLYSLKLATKPVAAKYTEVPLPGSMGHAIKRISRHKSFSKLQFEMWYAYTPEQDRNGLSEQSIRAFGAFFDYQDPNSRSHIGVRYLNSVDGELKQRWQCFQMADGVTDKDWGYGSDIEWARAGVDAMWYGRRYPDGRTDGFTDIAGGEQQLCYNEADDKINWLYLRFLVDVEKREYIEMQSGDKIIPMRGYAPTKCERYARIDGLLNPSVWIETDTDRSVFLYVDSVVVSVE